jgi:hypothetical protein
MQHTRGQPHRAARNGMSWHHPARDSQSAGTVFKSLAAHPTHGDLGFYRSKSFFRVAV